ncbi:uncharacterized protein VTP21DRAFT_9968 [Calcarisporiella thermophila]|uniref:uncharacterized protein n=1 Tax=Calcarisporiella thermophila TaxID=911321 RepID=UPI00374258D1
MAAEQVQALVNENEDNSNDKIVRDLAALSDLKGKQDALGDLKQQLFELQEQLEQKEHLLDEVSLERGRLQREKLELCEMLRGLQRDIESVTEVERNVKAERDGLRERLKRIREESYEPLKEEVDKKRIQHQLRKLPNLQDELDQQMARYLEQRRLEKSSAPGRPSIQASNPSTPASSTTTTSTSRRRSGAKRRGRPPRDS